MLLFLVLVPTLIVGVSGAVGARTAAVDLGRAVESARPVMAQVGCRPRWQHPVPVTVVDGYRPPTGPFGPGNRGFEYGTVGGEVVRSVAAGSVRFAGPVGGRWYVVVDHDPEPGMGELLRSTYGPVAEVAVAERERVDVATPLARARPGFHLTARVGDRYVDPGPLLAGPCHGPRLVPVDR